jgi:thymidylate synthase
MNPICKEEFLEKLKTDRDFNNRYGRKHIAEGKMVLPPCHYGFQVYTRELSKSERYVHLRTGKYSGKWDGTGDEMVYYDSIGVPKRAISLMWNQRSCDTFLGIPFNIASYGLLLEIIAKMVNMVPDELIGNLGDTHLYLNHIEQAKEQIDRELTFEEKIQWVMNNTDVAFEEDLYITDAATSLSKRTREPFELPTLNINTEFWPTEIEGFIKALSNDNFIGCLLEEDIQLGNYKSHQGIKAPLSN